MDVWRNTLVMLPLLMGLTYPSMVVCSDGNSLDGQVNSQPGISLYSGIQRSLSTLNTSLKNVLSEIERASVDMILEADSKKGSITGDLFDVSWMNGSDKKIFQNFITWYKMILVNLNALNPRTWNLDFIVPAVGSVVSLYTGPILALILVLMLFFTVPTFVQSIVAGGGRKFKEFPDVSQILGELGPMVDNALQRYNDLDEE